MGNFKEYLLNEEETELFNAEHNIIKTGFVYSKKNKEIEDFIKSIMPINAKYYYLGVDGVVNGNFRYTNIDDYISALSHHADTYKNITFMPASFKGHPTLENAQSIKCIFVDIDHPNINFDCPDLEVLEQLKQLYDYYDFDLFPPSFISCSGHGIHIYYIIPEIDLSNIKHAKKWTEITKKMIFLFKADISRKHPACQMRLPTSYNCKNNEKIKTKILFKSDCKYTISQLEKMLEDIEQFQVNEFFSEENEKRNIKAKETMAKNGTKRGRKKIIKDVSNDNDLTPKKKNKKHNENDNNLLPVIYAKNFNRYRPLENRIKNLHNYYIRHQEEMKGFRDIFTFIFALTYRQMNKSEEDAIKRIMIYFLNTNFEEEALTIIKNAYTGKNYKYNNVTIAELLQFNDDDYYYSFGLFTEEEKKLYKKQQSKKVAEKRKEKRRENKNKEQKALLSELNKYIDMPEKDLAILFDVSVRTIRRYKKKLKDSK